MTFGVWKCLKCGYETHTFIYTPLKICPSCGAKYETVKVLKGVHIVHPIPVQRLKETDKLNLVIPTCISLGENREAIKEFNKIVNEILKEDLEKAGKREITGKELEELSKLLKWLVKFGEEHGYKIKFTNVKQNIPKEFLETLKKIARKHPETVEDPNNM